MKMRHVYQAVLQGLKDRLAEGEGLDNTEILQAASVLQAAGYKGFGNTAAELLAVYHRGVLLGSLRAGYEKTSVSDEDAPSPGLDFLPKKMGHVLALIEGIESGYRFAKVREIMMAGLKSKEIDSEKKM
jgi:hypothetical protein